MATVTEERQVPQQRPRPRLPRVRIPAVPAPWPFVVGLFVGTKIVLTVVALAVLYANDTVPGMPPPEDQWIDDQQRDVSSHRWISMWFAWDSFVYRRLAEAPLDEPWSDFAFPLLYPFLGRAVGAVFGGNAAAGLLVVGNVAYVVLLYYAYRLAETLTSDDADPGATARRFTRYIALMPAAFLFHAALTESIFLCLVLAAFYHAERQRWLVVGVIGYFLSLSRSVGLLVAVPLALVLLRQGDYRLGPGALWRYVKTGWPLLLLPAGWLSFMAFCRWQSGDWFAYKNAQQEGWGIVVQSPLVTLRDGLTVAEPRDTIRVALAVVVMAIVAAGTLTRSVQPAYLAYTLLMVLVPLSIGPPVYKSLIRYLLAVFPLALVFARWARHASVDTYLTATLALVQGALFAVWLTYWTHFII